MFMYFILAIVSLLVVGVFVLLMENSTRADKKVQQKGIKQANTIIRAKPILTEREHPMYYRLVQSLPESIIFVQVSFGAILASNSRATRNTFNRKIADFVVCNKSLEVLAIIELDDSSHKGREEKDAERDEMLKQAGYKILRYKTIPDVETVISNVLGVSAEKPKKDNTAIA